MSSEPIIQLGKKIVDELGLDQSVDTLGRWMSHYIAELILAAENASPEDRSDKMSRCASAILELWKHHDSLPYGRRPFESIESILLILDSLGLGDETIRYFRPIGEKLDKMVVNAESKEWLNVALGADYTARILIRCCLAQAAMNTIDQSKEWKKLADQAEAEDEVHSNVVHFITEELSLLDPSIADDTTYKKVKDRIKALDGFVSSAKMLSKELKQYLKCIDKTKQ